MTVRIIETVEEIAARQPSISQLPTGVYYSDPVYGLVVDYITDDIPEELIPLVVYACKEGGEVLKEAPKDFLGQHDFAGWPSCCKQEE